MLKSVLARAHVCGPRLLVVQSRGKMDRSVTPKSIGVSLIRMAEREEEESLYPTLLQLGVTTSDRVHTFSAPCHRVVKFIKMGAINKQISVQYCHYLAQLVRETTDNPEDRQYYAKHCGDLMSYILRSDKNLPMLTRADLLCDTATTSAENCQNVCSIFLEAEKLPPIDGRRFARLIGSCMEFGIWPECRRLLRLATHRLLDFRICGPFVDGLILAGEKFKALPEGSSEQESLRADVIETIYLLCELSTQYRIQFITKRKKDLLKALTDLQISVHVNPTIKMTGRCTACNSHLSLFDWRTTKELNEAIRSQIFKGADKGLFVNTSPNDSGRFEQFLEKLFECDKRPIDCVIDGLNIAHHNSVGYMHFKRQLSEDVSKTYKVPKSESLAHTLINTIIRGNILHQFKKILVVGKAHMLKWPGLMDFFRKNNIHFYSSFNNSKDDLFQLYASTLSPKSLLVTNDFLRDHLAQMDESNRTLMERWIDTHQVWICQKSLQPIFPTPYEKIPSVHRESGCFHLPVIDFDQLQHVGVSEPPPHLSSKSLTWLCCNTKPTKHEGDEGEING